MNLLVLNCVVFQKLMGQDGSRDNRWVVWVMGHVFDGSRGSWVTLYDPFAALHWIHHIIIPLQNTICVI